MSDAIQKLINAATDLFDADRAEAWRYPTVWEPVVDRLLQACQALQSGEPVVFTCHGNNAPAYGCNKPGDMSGTYYKAPQPVVPEDTLRAAFIAGFRYCAVEWAGRDDLYSDVHSEKFCKGMANALKALLSAGKENNNE